MSLKKNTYRYIIAKIGDNSKEVELLKAVPLSDKTTYKDFLAELPADDCRYLVYNYEYDFDGGHRSKIVFFQWAPENAKIKSKMLYASTKDSIKKALVGIQVEIQGTDKSEVEEAVLLEKCKSISK
eukprot:TRINITY_DN1558_c0_g1_i1.p1 TRINITY_DN1558_c0_g1~~TRINITY_DN1558_c0_g1_i1.p1  ORF type:complete len:126 (+),score=30.51 TRINITY_DN1558_c0_g1_i1:273-650(+)